MHRTSVEQWLSERGIVLEQGFVPALKDCVRAYKKDWPRHGDIRPLRLLKT